MEVRLGDMINPATYWISPVRYPLLEKKMQNNPNWGLPLASVDQVPGKLIGVKCENSQYG